jgi:hypothetical protein
MIDIIEHIKNLLILPRFRWFTLILSIILTLLQYLNNPIRFSYKHTSIGLPYKWYLYLLAIICGIIGILLFFSLWLQIPFTTNLPKYWYLYLFVLYISFITQLNLDSPQYADDNTFNPPPSYLMSQKYRVILSYATVIVSFLTMLQLYIYFGVNDTTKTTAISKYFLERFGGWYPGNKMFFLLDWAGLCDTIIKLYILYLQYNYQACNYSLPLSWNV